MKHFLKVLWLVPVLLTFFGSVVFAQEATYVGAKKCKMCHLKEYKAWQTTAKSAAYEDIADAPDKEKCYKCHTTGYGKEGGFVDIESTPTLAGVGCEACHGPGSLHLAVPFKDKEARRNTIFEQPTNCRNCHSPHIVDKAAAARGEE